MLFFFFLGRFIGKELLRVRYYRGGIMRCM